MLKPIDSNQNPRASDLCPTTSTWSPACMLSQILPAHRATRFVRRCQLSDDCALQLFYRKGRAKQLLRLMGCVITATTHELHVGLKPGASQIFLTAGKRCKSGLSIRL
eukprot:6176551-Pleurochrysis_carterae.AAC.3